MDAEQKTERPAPSGGAYRYPTLRDLDEAQFEVWLRLTFRLIAICYGAIFIAGVLLRPERVGSRTGELLVIAVALVAGAIQRRGYSHRAGVVMACAMYVELMMVVAVEGIQAVPGIMGAPLIVLGIGFFLGARWAYGIALVSGFGVAAAGIVFVSVEASLPLGAAAAAFLSAPAYQAALYTTSFVFVLSLVAAGFSRVTLRGIQQVVLQTRSSRARFKALVDHSPDTLLVLDDAARIEMANDRAEELFYRDRGNLLGKRLFDLALSDGSRLGEHLTPEALKRISDEPETFLMPSTDGERWLDARSRSLPRHPGEPGQILVLRDVTAVVKAKEELGELGGIVDRALHEIHIFHPEDLRILYLNGGARKTLGYDRRDPPVSMVEIIPTLTKKMVEDATSAGHADGGIFRTIQRRADGSVYPVAVVFRPGIFQGESAVISFAVDITERVRGEEEQDALRRQLEHSQKLEAVGHLAGGVAHDFNNLLTVMSACVESLRDEVPEDAGEILDELVAAQDRGAVLTRQLLAFARKEVVQPEIFSVREALEGMQLLAARLLTERVTLRYEFSGEPWVKADRGQFEQVVMNLLANARDAMPDGGNVTIRASTGASDFVGRIRRAIPAVDTATHVVLEVRDEGVGMDSETVERVFQPFFTTKDKGKGTGLGLATVHGIVMQNDGQIEVESEPGQGTVMRVTWPAAKPENRAAASSVHARAKSHERRVRILFAEDNEPARVLLSRAMKRYGHRVVSASDGAEALRRFKEQPTAFDMVVTDVVMPGLSGLELVSRMEEAGFDGPVLFISGYLDGHMTAQDALGEGRGLLLKPFRHEALLGRIDTLLSGESETDSVATN